MKRIDFLKNLSGVASMLVMPLNHLRSRKKTWLLKFHVRGFQYYKGPALISRMRKGEILKLVREPANKYDRHAIAIHYQDHKIGFVPAEKNEVFSRLLDSEGSTLLAEIINVEQDANPWEAVSAGIYLAQSTGLEA